MYRLLAVWIGNVWSQAALRSPARTSLLTKLHSPVPLRTILRPLLNTVLAAFTSGVGLRARAGYVGNRATHRYHRGDCLYARLPFFQQYLETRSHAIHAGYFPCGVCRPDLS